MKLRYKILVISVFAIITLSTVALLIRRYGLPKTSRQKYITSQMEIAGSYLGQFRLNPEQPKLLDNAMELYQKILKSDPNQKKAIEMVAEIYTFKTEYLKAQELYNKLIKLEPRNMKYHINVGFFYLAQDKKNEAFEKANFAILNDPENSRAYFLRAIIYEKDRNLSAAIADYKRAIAAAKKDEDKYRNISIYLNLGYLYSRLGLNYDAVQQYEKVVKLWPKVSEGHLALAQFYTDRGLFDKAVDALNALINMDKNSARGYYGLGIAYLKKGEAKSAYAYFKKAGSLGAQVDDTLMQKLAEQAKDAK